jgi:hypothetical protein
MHSLFNPLLKLTLLLGLMLATLAAPPVQASADKQSFWGLGAGLEVLNKDGSGTGFYFNAEGGYNFNSMLGLGLHAGYSNIGSVDVRIFDFGGFFQVTEADSGFYGKLLVDGVNASVDGGATRHGVAGTQTGLAPGLALGLLIPSAGDFHMVPEIGYRMAFLDSTVSLIHATFNLVWDL